MAHTKYIRVGLNGSPIPCTQSDNQRLRSKISRLARKAAKAWDESPQFLGAGGRHELSAEFDGAWEALAAIPLADWQRAGVSFWDYPMPRLLSDKLFDHHFPQEGPQ